MKTLAKAFVHVVGLCVVVVALFLMDCLLAGCTPQQKAALRADEAIVAADVHTGAAVLLGAVTAAESNPALVQEALALATSATTKPGVAPPQALLDAQAALTAGNLAKAHAVLATLVGATAPSPSPSPSPSPGP